MYQQVRRHSYCAGLCAVLLSLAVNADSVYEAEVPVAMQGETAGAAAMTQALRQVLAKRLAMPALADGSVYKALLPKASQYVQSFSYVASNDAAMPYKMRVQFSEKALENALAQFQPNTAPSAAPPLNRAPAPVPAAVPAAPTTPPAPVAVVPNPTPPSVAAPVSSVPSELPQTFEVEVEGIKQVGDVLRAQRQLESLNGSPLVRWLSLQGASVTFELALPGGAAAATQQLANNRLLHTLNSTEAALHYRLEP